MEPNALIGVESCEFRQKLMIPARGPQTWVGVIRDDADDGARDGDGGAGDDDADAGDGSGGAGDDEGDGNVG